MRGCCQPLPGYRRTGFFFLKFYSQSSNAATMTSQCHEGVPVVSKVISSKWHHAQELPRRPSAMMGGSFPVFKRTVDKQRMGETTDQHAGSQSNGRQSSNNLRHAWAPPLEAPPEIWQLRGQTSPRKVAGPDPRVKNTCPGDYMLTWYRGIMGTQEVSYLFWLKS